MDHLLVVPVFGGLLTREEHHALTHVVQSVHFTHLEAHLYITSFTLFYQRSCTTHGTTCSHTACGITCLSTAWATYSAHIGVHSTRTNHYPDASIEIRGTRACILNDGLHGAYRLAVEEWSRERRSEGVTGPSERIERRGIMFGGIFHRIGNGFVERFRAFGIE